jgi:hypothetical protein
MGYSNVNANLLTVPGKATSVRLVRTTLTAVYTVGALSFVTVAYFSDKYRIRSPFIVLGMSLNLIGEARSKNATH